MNKDWHNFLLSQQGIMGQDGSLSFIDDIGAPDNRIYPLTHFGVLTLSGADASRLLQGQITCNVNDVMESKSSLGAMCNAKGRVISTFILVKQANTFLMVMPAELVEIVQKKLQMYVLRSDVKITDTSEENCLLGLCIQNQSAQPVFFTEQDDAAIKLTLPGKMARKIFIASAANAKQIWTRFTQSQGYRKSGTGEWRYLDIIAGLPWLNQTTSEQFIPQMLNLDKLGGISFSKGCYTGQEVVARTHYLGKVKREMRLAECNLSELPAPNSPVIWFDAAGEQVVGHVLQAQIVNHSCVLQVILPVDDIDHNTLKLEGYNQPAIHLLTFAS